MQCFYDSYTHYEQKGFSGEPACWQVEAHLRKCARLGLELLSFAAFVAHVGYDRVYEGEGRRTAAILPLFDV